MVGAKVRGGRPPWGERVVRTDGTLAAWAAAWPLLRSFAPGERVEAVHEPRNGGARGTIRIVRGPDEADARAFECALKEPDGERRFTVLFGADGLPCGFREEMQQGVIVYRRLGR